MTVRKGWPTFSEWQEDQFMLRRSRKVARTPQAAVEAFLGLGTTSQKACARMKTLSNTLRETWPESTVHIYPLSAIRKSGGTAEQEGLMAEITHKDFPPEEAEVEEVEGEYMAQCPYCDFVTVPRDTPESARVTLFLHVLGEQQKEVAEP